MALGMGDEVELGRSARAEQAVLRALLTVQSATRRLFGTDGRSAESETVISYDAGRGPMRPRRAALKAGKSAAQEPTAGNAGEPSPPKAAGRIALKLRGTWGEHSFGVKAHHTVGQVIAYYCTKVGRAGQEGKVRFLWDGDAHDPRGYDGGARGGEWGLGRYDDISVSVHHMYSSCCACIASWRLIGENFSC